MSLKTWKKEFYPVSGETAGSKSILFAIEHSIRKWEGLKAANLEWHGVKKTDYFSISDKDDDLTIDGRTCSLCCLSARRMDQRKSRDYVDNCQLCPIFKANDEFACTNDKDDKQAPFHFWDGTGDPRPMIALLNKTLKFYKKKLA